MKLLLICVIPLLMARPEVAKKTSGTQSISVKGVLRCGSKAAKGVLIKLIDEDFGQDTDDMLGRVHTDENGSFELKGHTTEFTAIDTSLSIYHDCNDGITPCQRRWRFEIPSKYVSTGETPTKKEVRFLGPDQNSANKTAPPKQRQQNSASKTAPTKQLQRNSANKTAPSKTAPTKQRQQNSAKIKKIHFF